MTDSWYENSSSCYDPPTSGVQQPVSESFHSYEQADVGDVSKNVDVMSSLGAFQNCFYSQQPPDYHSGFNNQQQEVDGKTECFQESSGFEGYSNYPDYSKYENNLRWPQNQNLLSPYSGRFWPRVNRRQPTPTKESSIKVVLENKSLMERFHEHCTEMIITKTGRRMFPSPQISMEGLEANVKYFVLFDIVPADDNRYKFHHFNWVIAGKAEPHPPSRLYIHPESPLTGSQWMKQQIAFHKVKLTNNTCDQHGHMILNSMHRYQPRIHVVSASDIYSIQFQPFHTYTYPECQFIAVTAYQNSQITQLKIEHNPFAKGFRKPEKDKREKRKHFDEIKEESEPTPKSEKTEEGKETTKSEQLDKKELNTDTPVSSKRETGYFDLHHNRWNYNQTQPFNYYDQQRNQYPATCYPSDLRRSPVNSMHCPNQLRSEPFPSSSTVTTPGFNTPEKLPYFDPSKYPSSESALGGFEHARQYPYPTDYIMGACKSNVPSFI